MTTMAFLTKTNPTIDELIEALNKAKAESPWGGETVVYICGDDSELEYFQVSRVSIDRDQDGAVLLIHTEDLAGIVDRLSGDG